MKYLVRAVIILGFLVGLMTLLMLVVALFGPADDSTGSQPAAARCDLLKAGPCVWNTDAGRWSANLERVRDTSDGTAYRLEVSAPEAPDRFLAVLRGESMYMGEYPVALGQDADNLYTAQFNAPICSVDASMTWRIDLQEGQAPIEDVPVILVFEAAGR